MIVSTRGKWIAAIIEGRRIKGFPADLVKVAERRLAVLNAAERIGDLRSPPGNRLEKLSGDRNGQHSIRINDQWRLCFRWTEAGVEDAEILDYHS